MLKNIHKITLFSFHFYIYPHGLQESVRDFIHRISNYPELFSEMPRYCCPVEISYFGFLTFVLEIELKFRIDYQDRKAEKSAVKCLS